MDGGWGEASHEVLFHFQLPTTATTTHHHHGRAPEHRRRPCRHLPVLSLQLLCSYLPPLAAAYRPGDIVPMLRSGRYHGVLMPIPKPTGFTGADPYKL